MLTVTPEAADMIRDLLHATARPTGAGLRLAQRDDHPALAMSLADAAGPDDITVQDRGAVVFLGPHAARRTQRQVLDGQVGDSGSAFYLRD